MAKQQRPPDGRYVATQAAVASAFGVERSTVGAWVKKGMPGRQGRFDLVAIAVWYRTGGPGAERIDDPLLEHGDSPALERYRLARAKTAELDLALRKGELINKELCRSLMGRWANVLRRAGDRLNKRCGTEGASILREALDECSSLIAGIEDR